MDRTLICIALLLLGCGKARERPPANARDAAAQDAAWDADAEVPDSGGLIAVAPCPAASLDAFPLDVAGDTTGASSEFEPSCAGAAGPDVAIVWTAPSAGRFRVSTAGSVFDTVLAVLDGVCSGTELACHDDIDPGTLQSETALSLAAGQTVTVVVDGLDPQEAGAFRLRIDFD